MSSAATSTLQRKLRKAVEPQAGNPDVIAALRELSTIYGDNTLSARRNLRSTIERRSVVLNHGLLSAFNKLQCQLDTIDREVEGLSDACGAISTQLARSRASTEVMLSQTARLREEIAVTEQRSAVADAFIGCFGLTPEDEAVLNAPHAVELEPLLAALERVQAHGTQHTAHLLAAPGHMHEWQTPGHLTLAGTALTVATTLCAGHPRARQDLARRAAPAAGPAPP